MSTNELFSARLLRPLEDYSPHLRCPFKRIYQSQLQRDDLFYMKLAYNEAIKAWEEDEIPVGAVIEHDGQIIASAHNRVEATRDPTAHAEILAISQACHFVKDWRLNGASLYVTKEPCPMCSGALMLARLTRIVYALPDPEMGGLGGTTQIDQIQGLRHRISVSKGGLEEECRRLLQSFFSIRRAGGPRHSGRNDRDQS